MLEKGGFELLTKNRTKEKCGKGIKRRRENQSTREKDSPETDETSFVVEQDVSANGIFSLLLCSEMLSVEAFALGGLEKTIRRRCCSKACRGGSCSGARRARRPRA